MPVNWQEGWRSATNRGEIVPKRRARRAPSQNAKSRTGQLEKTIYSSDYAFVLRLLRAAREESGITQVELAGLLGQSQSFVSKMERGDRRLDIIQLRTIVMHFGLTLTEFVERLEKSLVN